MSFYSADFNASRTRLLSGTTWFAVWEALVGAVAEAGIVDKTRVIPVLDDETLPVEIPPDSAFITVRLPSLIWSDGDVMSVASGTGVLSELLVTGQTRVSLWLRNERDAPGYAKQTIEQAIAAPQLGAKTLGRLVGLFWERDLIDDQGQALLNRVMKLISIEPPTAGRLDVPRPWRITVEISFRWLLSQETLPS